MSIPLVASVKPESTLPFAGQIQATASASVAGGLSGSAGGGATGAASATFGDGGTAATPPSEPLSCARAFSENGSFCARGSTFAVAELASGLASMGGPADASGVATGDAIVAGVPAGPAS